MIILTLLLTVGLILLLTLFAALRAFTSKKAFTILFVIIFVVGVAGGVLFVLK
jgi:hypothetical protein